MYKGKHSKKRKYRLTPWAIFALVLLLTLSVGGTVAYLSTTSGTVTNTFTPAPVECEIVEPNWKDDDTTKSGVFIKNTGEADAFIRAAIVITWQDKAGNVYGQVPVSGTDYELYLNETDWTKIGNYWYCTSAASGATQTPVLINSCTTLKSLDGYTLSVEILAQAIQAEPAQAVADAWGTVSGLAVIAPGGDR